MMFSLSVADTIDLRANIRGSWFEAASIFTELRFSGPESSGFTVFEVVRAPDEVPEPGTLVLVLTGALGAVLVGRSRHRLATAQPLRPRHRN
jgi:hypothetical protein